MEINNMVQPMKPITFVGAARIDIESAVRFAESTALTYLKELGPNAPVAPFAVQTIADGSGWRHLITYLVPVEF